MRKRISLTAVLALVAILSLPSCATIGKLTGSTAANAYATASQAYNAGSLAYTQAGNNIQNLRTIGKVTDAQWTVFVSYQAVERAADNDLKADLDSWLATGKEPPTYAAHKTALDNAQANVIALSGQVHL